MDDVRADTGACSYKIGSCNPFKLQEYRGSSMQQRWRIREGARRSTSTTKAALPGPSLQVSFIFFQSLPYHVKLVSSNCIQNLFGAFNTH